MIQIVRTDSNDPHFIELVKQLDAELSIRDGSEYSFYAQFNRLDMIKHAVVAYENDKPVACGAIKEYDAETMEVKRMFTLPEYREKGIAGKILLELERWTKELSFKKCVLETGKKQPEALALYKKHGYISITNYGQYAGVENSLCFEKKVNGE